MKPVMGKVVNLLNGDVRYERTNNSNEREVRTAG